MVQEGGCLCGAIRFSANGQPQAIRHCHCMQCRKGTGAAFVTGLMYRASDVVWQGNPASFESSDGIRRVFCASCGGTLAFRQDNMARKEVLMLGAMDAPDQIALPESVEHVFAERELHWLKVDDGFARIEGQPALYEIK